MKSKKIKRNINHSCLIIIIHSNKINIQTKKKYHKHNISNYTMNICFVLLYFIVRLQYIILIIYKAYKNQHSKIKKNKIN